MCIRDRAKNYMTHEEISTLNLIVNMYLDYAELQAKGHHPMHMADWEDVYKRQPCCPCPT